MKPSGDARRHFTLLGRSGPSHAPSRVRGGKRASRRIGFRRRNDDVLAGGTLSERL
jgi:hypothetical protein